jgi:hypothetical protein
MNNNQFMPLVAMLIFLTFLGFCSVDHSHADETAFWKHSSEGTGSMYGYLYQDGPLIIANMEPVRYDYSGNRWVQGFLFDLDAPEGEVMHKSPRLWVSDWQEFYILWEIWGHSHRKEISGYYGND